MLLIENTSPSPHSRNNSDDDYSESRQTLSLFSFPHLLPVHTDALNGLVIIMHMLWFAVL